MRGDAELSADSRSSPELHATFASPTQPSQVSRDFPKLHGTSPSLTQLFQGSRNLPKPHATLASLREVRQVSRNFPKPRKTLAGLTEVSVTSKYAGFTGCSLFSAAALESGPNLAEIIGMAQNFYHGRDADVVAGAANFAALINSSPSSYGLTSAQAAAFGLLDAALQDAYSAAITPSTRTPVAVEAKNVAIRNMRVSAVNLSKIAYATPTVSDAQLISLGLLPRPTRTPIPAPAEAPVIDVISVTGNTVKLRLHAAGEPTRRGKPTGVDGASVFSFVGAAPPATEAEWTFQVMTGRPILDVTFPPKTAAGAKVWFTAFWFNGRKQNGPAASPVGTNIPGNAAMAA